MTPILQREGGRFTKWPTQSLFSSLNPLFVESYNRAVINLSLRIRITFLNWCLFFHKGPSCSVDNWRSLSFCCPSPCHGHHFLLLILLSAEKPRTQSPRILALHFLDFSNILFLSLYIGHGMKATTSPVTCTCLSDFLLTMIFRKRV